MAGDLGGNGDLTRNQYCCAVSRLAGKVHSFIFNLSGSVALDDFGYAGKRTQMGN